MKLTTILILGAATLATPCFAQSDANASSDNTSNGQVAMNNSASDSTASGNSIASAVSSIPDTEKKYKASSRAADFQKEAQTTKELNQQMASADGIPEKRQ